MTVRRSFRFYPCWREPCMSHQHKILVPIPGIGKDDVRAQTGYSRIVENLASDRSVFDFLAERIHPVVVHQGHFFVGTGNRGIEGDQKIDIRKSFVALVGRAEQTGESVGIECGDLVEKLLGGRTAVDELAICEGREMKT